MKLVPPRSRVKAYGIVAVAFGVFWIVVWWSGEPTYRGESLSQWLENVRGTPGDSPDDQAVQAIRAIGPRAVPTLLDMLKRGHPHWKTTVAEWTEKVDWSPSLLEDNTDQRRFDAVRGFRILGKAADSALPALRLMLDDSKTGPWAAASLGSIGSHTAPLLVEGLTNTDYRVRESVVYALTRMESNAPGIYGQMGMLRADANQYIAGAAVHWLLRNGPTSERARILHEALEGGQRYPIFVCLSWLRETRPIEWTNMVPDIVPLLNSTNRAVRAITTNTLKALNPAIAASVGIDTNPPTPRGTGSGQFRRGGGRFSE